MRAASITSGYLYLTKHLMANKRNDDIPVLQIDKAQQDLAELNKSKTDEVLGYNSTIAALHSKLEK